MTVAEIRDALVAYLTAQGVANVTGVYRTAVDLKDIVDPAVCVVPVSQDSAPITRAKSRIDTKFDIAYRVVCASDAVAVLDPHSAAVEAISDLLAPGLVIASGCPVILTSNRSPLWSPEHLESYSVFTSILQIGFVEVD